MPTNMCYLMGKVGRETDPSKQNREEFYRWNSDLGSTGKKFIGTYFQRCGAGAARSRNFWLDRSRNIEVSAPAPGSRSAKVVNKNKNSCRYSVIKNIKNVLFNITSVITGSSKVIAGAGAGAGAVTFWKSEPERKQIVSAPQNCLFFTLNRLWNTTYTS